MNETRAIAHLPQLDIEILHREAAEGEAECLTITLRAAPSFAGFTAWLDPLRLAHELMTCNPLLVWWRPLLGGAGLDAACLAPGKTATAAEQG